jgi:hypothetical protein
LFNLILFIGDMAKQIIDKRIVRGHVSVDVYDVVDEFPKGYYVWNTGRCNFPYEGYVPLVCFIRKYQIDFKNLKALKVENEDIALAILEAAALGRYGDITCSNIEQVINDYKSHRYKRPEKKCYPITHEVIIHPNGDTTYVDPKNGTDFSLEELQSIVGGDIEILNIPDYGEIHDRIFVINEEGKLNGLEYNEYATVMARMNGTITLDDYFVGDVLFCHSNKVK